MGIFDKAKDKVEDLARERMGGNDNTEADQNQPDQNQDENQSGGGMRDKAEDAIQDVRDRFGNN
jgi:hypothetical protein